MLRRLAGVNRKGIAGERRRGILVGFDVVSVYVVPGGGETGCGGAASGSVSEEFDAAAGRGGFLRMEGASNMVRIEELER
jgi:hypothetical protein